MWQRAVQKTLAVQEAGLMPFSNLGTSGDITISSDSLGRELGERKGGSILLQAIEAWQCSLSEMLRWPLHPLRLCNNPIAHDQQRS